MFRCITDPTDGVAYWQGPDGVFRPLMRCYTVHLEDRGPIDPDAIRERVLNPIPQGIRATMEFDDDDPKAEQMREMIAAFKRRMLETLRAQLPAEIYETLPEWAKVKEEKTP